QRPARWGVRVVRRYPVVMMGRAPDQRQQLALVVTPAAHECHMVLMWRAPDQHPTLTLLVTPAARRRGPVPMRRAPDQYRTRAPTENWDSSPQQ
ncbi:hypothetical protein, partial [Mycobacterium canetti]